MCILILEDNYSNYCEYDYGSSEKGKAPCPYCLSLLILQAIIFSKNIGSDNICRIIRWRLTGSRGATQHFIVFN